MTRTVLNLICELWNWPRDQRPSPYADFEEYLPNPAVTGAEIFSALSQVFSNAEIEQEISRFLVDTIAAFRSNQRPTQLNLFAAKCCLDLLSMRGGYHSGDEAADNAAEQTPCPVHVEADIVQGIVETFPPMGWYSSVCRLIQRYLSESEVLEALSTAISAAHPQHVMLSLLAGIRLYSGQGMKDTDPTRLLSATTKLGSVLVLLEQSSDSTIQNAARSANNDLSRYMP